jgi:ribosomal-protein-serine acetyltransferase
MSAFCLPIDSQTDLRLIETKDAAHFFQLIDRNRTYLRQWLGWLDVTRSIPDLEKFIHACSKQFAERTGFSCLIWNQGRIVDIVHLRDCDPINRKAMIGYWVGEEFRGQSFAKKATKTIVDYAFRELKLNRIEIKCATGNVASQAIPKSLGFTNEGILRENEWLYDHFVDHFLFSLLAHDWQRSEKVHD